MLGVNHEGNVIDVNKKGSRLSILLSKMSFILNNSLMMQTNTEIMSQMDYLGSHLSGKWYCMILYTK